MSTASHLPVLHYRSLAFAAMKSHTEYVRQECVADIRRQIAAYKRFKTLTEQWIDVSIEASKLKIPDCQEGGIRVEENSVLSRYFQ